MRGGVTAVARASRGGRVGGERAAKLAQLDAAMAVGIRREKFQRGAQMQSCARHLAVGELVIGDRGAQQAEVEFPVGGVVVEQVHRVFHRFMRFEKFAAIEQLDAECELRVDFVHRETGPTAVAAAQGSSSLSDSSACRDVELAFQGFELRDEDAANDLLDNAVGHGQRLQHVSVLVIVDKGAARLRR